MKNMNFLHLSSLYTLLISLPLVGAAATDVVVKKYFTPRSSHATARIHISTNGVDYHGIVSVESDSFYPTTYTYQSVPIDNQSCPNNNPYEIGLNLWRSTVSSNDPAEIIKHVKSLSVPEHVAATLKKFFNTYNSFGIIEEAQIRALQKKKWQEDKSGHALRLRIEGKRADEEFSRELDGILKYHEDTYGVKKPEEDKKPT